MRVDKDKALGMLIGLHVGDCLGVPLEFEPPITNKEEWVTEITGGGEFNFAPGEGSDDTDLMLCILRSLSKNKGEFVLHDIARNFGIWKKGNPPDIGNTTRWGIKNIMDGKPLNECGSTDEASQGNGSIMRCAPLALIDASYEDIVSQASLTHAHTNCIEADNYFINMLHQQLIGYGEAMFFGDWFTDEYIISYLTKCHELAWEDLPTSGWCIHSLGSALWALHNYDNFEDALIAVVNRGDDADTTGAVAGALLGAVYGYKSIPKRWVYKLKSAHEIEALAGSILK